MRNTFRQPQAWIPGTLFPLLLAAVYTAQFHKAIPNYADFLLPASILQAAAFGAVNGGADFALDIETGFFDRLVASPVSRTSILVGRLAGSGLFAGVQAGVIIVVFVALLGARIQGGLAAVPVLVVAAMLLALGIGGLGLVLALRTGSQEATQSTFPVIFVLLFMSSAFFPVDQMKGWYQTAAEHNPVTFIIDPLRRLVVQGWSWHDAAAGLGYAFAFMVLTNLLALMTLRRKLAAT